MKLKRTKHSIPELNTASLPDLIFTVLFFFMIITHMRENNVQVRYEQPSGQDVTKVEKKSSVIRVYIGKLQGKGDEYTVQVDNQVLPTNRIADYIIKEREKMSADRQQQLTISFKADKHAPMWLITEVKQALREANSLKVNYSAYEEGSAEEKENTIKDKNK